jgi:archaellum component FlaG (FlaF/FlaG flagellin family)
MDFIYAIVAAVVITASAGGAATQQTVIVTGAGADAADQVNQTQCDAPCSYDAETDTYFCPC